MEKNNSPTYFTLNPLKAISQLRQVREAKKLTGETPPPEVTGRTHLRALNEIERMTRRSIQSLLAQIGLATLVASATAALFILEKESSSPSGSQGTISRQTTEEDDILRRLGSPDEQKKYEQFIHLNERNARLANAHAALLKKLSEWFTESREKDKSVLAALKLGGFYLGNGTPLFIDETGPIADSLGPKSKEFNVDLIFLPYKPSARHAFFKRMSIPYFDEASGTLFIKERFDTSSSDAFERLKGTLLRFDILMALRNACKARAPQEITNKDDAEFKKFIADDVKTMMGDHYPQLLKDLRKNPKINFEETIAALKKTSSAINAQLIESMREKDPQLIRLADKDESEIRNTSRAYRVAQLILLETDPAFEHIRPHLERFVADPSIVIADELKTDAEKKQTKQFNEIERAFLTWFNNSLNNLRGMPGTYMEQVMRFFKENAKPHHSDEPPHFSYEALSTANIDTPRHRWFKGGQYAYYDPERKTFFIIDPRLALTSSQLLNDMMVALRQLSLTFAFHDAYSHLTNGAVDFTAHDPRVKRFLLGQQVWTKNLLNELVAELIDKLKTAQPKTFKETIDIIRKTSAAFKEEFHRKAWKGLPHQKRPGIAKEAINELAYFASRLALIVEDEQQVLTPDIRTHLIKFVEHPEVIN